MIIETNRKHTSFFCVIILCMLISKKQYTGKVLDIPHDHSCEKNIFLFNVRNTIYPYNEVKSITDKCLKIHQFIVLCYHYRNVNRKPMIVNAVMI